MSFDSMSFGEAVRFVQLVGIFIDVMLLSVPIAAICAVFRGRRNRPTRRSLFPHFVLSAWVLLLLAGMAYLFTGAWYSESGPPPQRAALQITWMGFGVLVCVAAVHIGLHRSTQPLHEGNVA